MISITVIPPIQQMPDSILDWESRLPTYHPPWKNWHELKAEGPLDGPFGPGFPPPPGEYSSRYFRFFRVLWNDSSVEGLMRYCQINSLELLESANEHIQTPPIVGRRRKLTRCTTRIE